jgi:hypothetical protein
MNRPLPPGNRGHRIQHPGWPSGPARIVPGAGRLVGGTAAAACRPDKEKPPRGDPGGRRRAASCESGFDGIAARPVFAFGGFHRKAQLFANRPGQEPTNAVGLPASSFHGLTLVFDLGTRIDLSTQAR